MTAKTTLLTPSASELYRVTRLSPITLPDGRTFYHNLMEIELQQSLETIKALKKCLQAKDKEIGAAKAESEFYKRDWQKMAELREADKKEIAALKSQNREDRALFKKLLKETHAMKK